MDVQGASFVIGRSADMVQWVDTATGVSRAHVELSRNKSGYVIKDLGSVNGTILQGNILAPYKEYPLADGDTFTLAESVYIYRSVG
ncbi:FHA domain-containing protein FhaA [compost metagenome]